jgi:hypothetical protein
MKYHELTKYPKIFSNSYWGNHEVKDDTRLENIILCRNAFVEFFRISEYIDNERPSKLLRIFDHCELYKSDFGYIYIVSPYNGSYDNDSGSYGFIKGAKLYNENCETYLKSFDHKNDFDAWIKKI